MERLKSRKQIEQLFREGKSFAVTPYRIFYRFSEIATEPLQFGVGVSTKNFKKAVDRNRIKRLTREVWRLQKGELKQLLFDKQLSLNVFFIFTGKEIANHNFVQEKVTVILNKLLKLVNENNTPHP